jgi:hypothetical protein
MFDCRVHNEIQNVFGPRGKPIPNKSTAQYSHRKNTTKKPPVIKKAIEEEDFDAILSEVEIMNNIKISLLDVERKLLTAVDCRIDGYSYLERVNKYNISTPEEDIKSATERRNFIRKQMTIQLREYLYKRSLKTDDGRNHIHYCNYASAVKGIRRVSENIRQTTPEPPDSVETPSSQAEVTPTPDLPSRLNPMAPSFVLRTISDDSTMSPSRDSQYETETDSPSESKRAVSPIIRVNAIYNQGINQLDRILQQSSLFQAVRIALDNASPISFTTPSPLIVALPPASPLIVDAQNSNLTTEPPITSATTIPAVSAAPTPIVSAAPILAVSTALTPVVSTAPTPVVSTAPNPVLPTVPVPIVNAQTAPAASAPAASAPVASAATVSFAPVTLVPTNSAPAPTVRSTVLPDDDDDSDPDSSDSSSFDNSSDNSSDDSDEDSSSDGSSNHHRCRKSRNKKNKKKKSKRKQRSTAKIVFELSKNASHQDFKPLEFHLELEKRQRSFLFFTQKLRQLCRTTPELRKVFKDHDRIHDPKTAKADAALYDFLLSKVSNKTATMLKMFMSEHKRKDGITAYKFLRSLSAPQDPDSQHRALTNFRNMYLKDNENIQSFNQHFNTALTNVQATGISIPKNDIIDQYLRAVKTINHSQIQVDVKLYKRQGAMESETPTEINLSEMQGEFQREEELTFDDTKRRLREVSTKAHANNATTSKPSKPAQKNKMPKTGGLQTKAPDYKEMICHGCNTKGHRLRHCKTTSAIDRLRIIDKMEADKKTSNQQKNKANISVETPNEHTANTVEHQVHHAYMAKTRSVATRNDKAESTRFYASKPNVTKIVVYESDVIIDSGATEHMTGDLSHLDNQYPYYTSVTTADGSTCETTTTGIMRVQCECTVSKTIYNIPLLNTLYVPNFRVNLWSIASFNASGHVMYSHAKVCTSSCIKEHQVSSQYTCATHIIALPRASNAYLNTPTWPAPYHYNHRLSRQRKFHTGNPSSAKTFPRRKSYSNYCTVASDTPQ